MADEQTEREIVELEKEFWQAMVDKDAEAAMKLSDDVCLVAGAQGASSFSKESLTRMVEDASYTLQRFELSQPTVRMLGDDVAIVTYKAHEEMTVDAKPLSLDAAEASTWVRRDGQWVCALHSESIIGDPYGRDRKAVQ